VQRQKRAVSMLLGAKTVKTVERIEKEAYSQEI